MSPELLELARAALVARGQDRNVLAALLLVACEQEHVTPRAVIRRVRTKEAS